MYGSTGNTQERLPEQECESIILLSGLCVLSLDGSPIPCARPRWETPCSCSPSAPDAPSVEINLTDVWKKAAVVTSLAANKSHVVQNIYDDRIDNPDVLRFLNNQTAHGLQMDHINESLSLSVVLNYETALLQDYHQLSLVALYWDVMIKNQEEHEFLDYVNEMKSVTDNVYAALCHLHTGIDQLENISIDFVESSAMPGYVQEAGSHLPYRAYRNYVIAKQSSPIMEYLVKRFKYLSEHFTNQ